MAFWKKFYKSKYTGAEIDAAVAKAGDATKVTANPTLAGTEAALTGLEVGETKYKVEQPINVVANPTLAGTEAALEGLQVGDTKYKIEAGGGSSSLYYQIDLTDQQFSDLEDNGTVTVTGLNLVVDDIKSAILAGTPVLVNVNYTMTTPVVMSAYKIFQITQLGTSTATSAIYAGFFDPANSSTFTLEGNTSGAAITSLTITEHYSNS